MHVPPASCALYDLAEASGWAFDDGDGGAPSSFEAMLYERFGVTTMKQPSKQPASRLIDKLQRGTIPFRVEPCMPHVFYGGQIRAVALLRGQIP